MEAPGRLTAVNALHLKLYQGCGDTDRLGFASDTVCAVVSVTETTVSLEFHTMFNGSTATHDHPIFHKVLLLPPTHCPEYLQR